MGGDIVEFINYAEDKDKFGIYKIVNKSNNKVYVGQTSQPFKKRYWLHLWKLNHGVHDNTHLQSAFETYGDKSFYFEVIESCSGEDNLNKLECQYIEHYDSYRNGYNMTTGGDGKRGCPMSESARKTVGEKNRAHMTGRKCSESTRMKMSASSAHKPCSDAHKEILRAYMKNRVVSSSTRNKIAKANMGSKSSFAKIKENVVEDIMLMLMSGESPRSISKKLSVGYQTITSIRSRKTWKHVYVDGFDEWSHRYVMSNKINNT